MGNRKVNLPYFDEILAELEDQNEDMETVFGKHIHWGYWEDPKKAEGTYEDFRRATELLCEKVWSLGKIKENDFVLDVGCGFGGTLSSLNEAFSSLKMFGLNIDQRQINRAKKIVKAEGENQIDFVQGSASKLPFKDNYFDVVLAVECIFHFPDREDFFREVQRVLKPGGYFAISDFVISFQLPSLMSPFLKGPGIPFYGNIQLCLLQKYKDLAKKFNFEILEVEEITDNVLPTYPIVKKIFSKNKVGHFLTLVAQISQLTKIIRYKNISFQKK